MKHIRKFENYRLECPECGQGECNCSSECPECRQGECNCSSEPSDNEYYTGGTNYQPLDADGNDWSDFDKPYKPYKPVVNDDDNDGEDLETEGDDDNDGEKYWGDDEIEIHRESNLLMFKDFFINEKKKQKKKVSKYKPDFLDLNDNKDRDEPMKKAYREAKKKESKKK